MDYEKYRFSPAELARGLGIYIGLDAAVAYFFYRTWIVFLILLPLFPVFLKFYRESLKLSRKQKLAEEFSETLISVSTNIKAGYSLENAFPESLKDIKMFYGEKSLMVGEIQRIRKGLMVNKPLEELMEDLGKRSGVEEIILFADVLKVAKRNGGNITEVLSDTADRVREKICVDKEIKIIIAEKKLELRVMEGIPFFILLYLDFTSRGYFDVLYSGLEGRILMTGCLAVYIAAVLLAGRIVRIRV